MAHPDPSPRPRRGTVPRVELDGSVTLYGIEDWTELSEAVVVVSVPGPDAVAPDAPHPVDDEDD